MFIPKVSVIVPVYNTETYLNRCIDSLLSQTFQDFEILLINDGSTDKSGEICDRYAQIDSRIRVFHKKNGGVSSARQCGLDNALGEYVIHADSDDWVSSKWLSLQIEACLNNDADVCISGFTEVGHGLNLDKMPGIYNNNEAYLLAILNRTMHASLCNKLIKTALFKDNNIVFIPGLDLREDFSVLYKVLYFASKIVSINNILYYYDVSNTDSIIHNLAKFAYQEDRYQLIQDEQDFINSYNPAFSVSSALYKDMVNTLGYNLLYGDLQLAQANKKIIAKIPYKSIIQSEDNIFILLNICAKLNMYCIIEQIRNLLNKRK